MKKNLISALLCALAIVGLAACNKPEEKFEQDKTHTVTFMAQVPSDSETKTAIMLKMVPDWHNTDVNDVHIFETETSSSGTAYFMEASKVEMTTPVDGTWEKAYFYAEFDNATVIVNPPTALTKAGSTFDYTAIMATRVNDRYFVPSVQYPDSESLIDPKADFLIGKTSSSYSSSRHEQRVNLNFKRPVSLSRLAITNLEGSTVESVKITCVENTNTYNGIITGEVGYADVDFAKSTAAFQANAKSYELTLSYPDGLKRTATTYVYMVTIPGKKSVQSVEVVTDKYVYTKSYATPASLNFTANAFSNIAMDMTVKNGGNVTRVKREGVEMEYEDADGKPVSEFVYDLNDAPTGGFPQLFVATPASAGTITYTSSNDQVASIDAEGNVTLTGNTGETVITATASGDGQYVSSSASYTLKVVDNAESSKYVKITSTDDLYAGAKYLLVFEGLAGDTDGDGDPKVFHPVLDGNTFVKNASSALDVTIVDNTITSSKFAACELTLEEGFFLMADEAGQFIYPSGTSGGSGTLSAEATASTKLDITFADGIAQVKAASGSNYFVWSVSSHYFSSNATISGQYSTGICLYMKDDGRQSQSIAFSSDVAEFDVYAGDWTVGIPALSGAQTKVTYTSSNESVVTVDPDSGAVTIVSGVKKGDKAVITATAEQDASYRAASASYTIKIVDSTPTVMTKYYKVDELVAGQSYIIVSDGKAMTFDGTDLGAVEVTDVDGVIETDEDLALWAAAEHVEYYSGSSAAGHFTLKSGDSYLQRLSNSGTQTAIAGDVPSNGKYYVWDYDGEHLSHLSSATTTFYLGYSSGWQFTYQSPYYTATLYSTTKPLAKQTISFSGKTAVYDVATSDWTTEVPTLTGAQTAVAYTSSNEEVATVDPSTGAVTIMAGAKKGDIAVITATAVQTTEYAVATATYTISIVDNSVPQPAGTTYTLVTKQADVVEGKYLIVSASDAYVYNGTGTYQGGYATIADADNITIDGDVITIAGETAAYEFAFAKSGNGFTITGEKGMIVAAENSGASSSEQTYITFAATGGSVFLQRGNLDEKPEALLFSTTRGSSSEEYLYYHTTNKIFKIGGSGKSNGIHLYFAGERAAQTIAYSKTEDSYDMASEMLYEAPTLTGDPQTAVSYSSSDTKVATVDANGVVTPVGKGEATITATAIATNEYLSATASYTLTVVSSQSSAATYTKVDEITSGATYLIVAADDGNYNKLDKKSAFAGDEAGSSVEVDGTSGTITGDYSACEFVITAEGDAYVLKGPNGYVTGNSSNSYSRYIQVSSSAVTMSLTDAATLKAASSSDGQVSDAFYFYYTKSSSKEVLYLNADGKYKIGGSGRKYGVYLYKKN